MSSNQPHDIDISDSDDIFDLIYPNGARYIHKTLQTSDSIRVLELLPGTSGSVLSCQILEIHRTDSDVEFEAISYVWGSPIPACYLLEVESNCMLGITESLYLALKALRYTDRTRRLWADAICINQSDNDEKSHQVANMGTVYAMASMVIVWLGDENLGETFKTLEELEEALENGNQTPEPKFTGALDSGMDAILEIFNTPWFTRLWIIQEFVLAKNVQFWAGVQHINCKTLEDVFKHHELRFLQLRLDMLKCDGSWGLDSTLDDSLTNYVVAGILIELRTMWRDRQPSSSQGMSLYDCCLMVHRRPPKCTDKRDLIYALLGLASTHTKIVPNYNLSPADVFLEFTWSVLMNGNMQILRHAAFLQQWLQGYPCPTFLYVLDSRSFALKSRGPQNTGKSRASHAQIVRPASVRIRGVAVDCISARFGFDIDDAMMVYQNRRIYRRHCQRSEAIQIWDSPVYDSPPVFIDEGWLEYRQEFPENTFSLPEQDFRAHEDRSEDQASLPRSAGSRNPDNIEAETLKDVYLAVQADAERLLHEEPMRKDLTVEEIRNTFWRTITSHMDITPPAMPEDFGHVSWEDFDDYSYPQFFTTAKGYMGKAPSKADVGDVVVIFDGSEVPFVIRKTLHDDDVRWKLVGECYVDGWMDGSYSGHDVVDDVDQCHAVADMEPVTDFSSSKKTLLSEYFVLC
jgi:hypothetical protein